MTATATTPSSHRTGGRRFWIVAVALTLVLAGIASFYASSSPDGLERVATDEGFADTARDHDLADSPLADYGVEGVDDTRASVGLAGVVGVAATLAVGGALFWLVRRRGGAAAPGASRPTPSDVEVTESAAAATRPGV
jgi:cobalt/nickel transport system permease protein